MEHSSDYWIRELSLLSHPEGGYYSQTYKDERLQIQADGFSGSRSASTAIYFLLTANSFSAFHRIKSDELWHFYAGDPLEILWINDAGELVTEKLGMNPDKGYFPQQVVPANHWFASRLCQEHCSPESYALVGCTVAPGFDFADFKLADRKSLTTEYPLHSDIIHQLTR